jgi:hypothetical protein
VKSVVSILPCLVTSTPEDGDSMFLRNAGIDLQKHDTKTQDLYNNMIIIAVRASDLIISTSQHMILAHFSYLYAVEFSSKVLQ